MTTRSGLAAPRAAERATSLLSAGLLFALSGCVQVSDFEPMGNAASIAGAWTIDGAPPTPESCRALGAEVVRVAVLDGARPVVHGALVFSCERTRCEERPCFDTRPDSVIAEGEWTFRIEAARGGQVVAVGPAELHSSAEGHIALGTAGFLSGRISAEHTIRGEEPTYERCQEAGIATVELAFETSEGPVAGAAREACAVGGVGARVEPGASYTVRLRARDEAGALVFESPLEAIALAAGEHVALAAGRPIELAP